MSNSIIMITCANLERGPSSCFKFSILTAAPATNAEEPSETYEIGKLANVQFKIKEKNSFYVFYKKNDLVGNTLTKIHLSSKTLGYSAIFYCSEHWSEVDLGKLTSTPTSVKLYYSNNNYPTTVRILKIDLFVHVSKEQRITNPLLYEDRDFTDFKLLAADGFVAVHKACLAARSDVFRRMFSGEWKETVEGGVDIKHVCQQTLQDMKDFIYLGKLPEDRLRPLIVVAKKYLMTDLVEACAEKLAETVSHEDLYSLHELAAQNLPELSCAIAELTPDRVVHEAYEIKMAKRNTAFKNDTK